MKRLHIAVCSAGLCLAVAAGGEVSGAVDCGEPVPAPKWEIGDTWRMQDEAGEERTETVVGIEGGLFRLEWAYPDSKAILFFDPDFVLRKVITRDGTVLEKPGKREWTSIGIKQWQYPMHVGKTWSFTYAWDDRVFWNTFRVVSCEEVSTVAGRFAALKLEGTRRRPDGRWQGIMHLWFAPSVKRIVRGEFQRPNFPDSAKNWELLRYRVKEPTGR